MIAAEKIGKSNLDLAMDAVNGVCTLIPIRPTVWKHVYSDGSVVVSFPWEKYVGLNASTGCVCHAGNGHSVGCSEKVSAV